MSEITLTAAVRTNLLALQTTTAFQARTNQRLSTGLRVFDITQDASAYFQAKALRDRAEEFNLRKEGIEQAIQALQAAIDGAEAVKRVVDQMNGVLQLAKNESSKVGSTSYPVGNGAANAGEAFADLVISNPTASPAGYSATDIAAGVNRDLFAKLGREWDGAIDQINSLVEDTNYGGNKLIAQGRTSTGQLDYTADSYTIQIGDESQETFTINGIFLGNPVILTDQQAGFSAGGAMIDPTRAWVVSSGLSGADNQQITFYNIPAGVRLGGADNLTVGFSGTYAVAGTNGVARIEKAGNFQPAVSYFYQADFGFQPVAGYTARMMQGYSLSNPASQNYEGWWIQAQDIGLGLLYSFQLEGLATTQGQAAAQALVNTAGQRVQAGIAKLGAQVAFLRARLDFNQEMVNAQEIGADKLTLADLNAESANAVALQTRQQLGVQSLQFAGATTSSLLNLFR